MGPSSNECAQIREALPELALGIADGEQRALALEHIAHCSDCRRELEQLSSVADDLIALAPQHEPPPGFENRVLDRLGVSRTRRRSKRWRLRRLAFAAAVPAVAAATVLAMSISYSSDRRLASQYRAALQGAHGKYFQSAHLNTPTGKTAGIVFAYQGSPSWLFYTLGGRYSGGLYREQIITRSGKTITLPPFRLINGSWGIATPIAIRDIARLTLTHQPRGPTLKATLPVIER
ncbi:MAG: anti-sigma factor family protein [Solirubrobacteraceae bacterium]